MRLKIFLLLAIAASSLLPVFGQPAIGKRAWDPAKTWVFMVTLVEWENPDQFAPFPAKFREDFNLFDTFKARGVPAKQMVMLSDKQATTARVRSEFAKFVTKPGKDDWIFVYFEGHGYKDESGQKTLLATYDASDDREGWPVRAIPDTIETGFKGSRAVLMLDNCYSGNMAQAVRAAKRRISYAIFASSLASELSTGNWTFTEALISGFRGANYTDDNGDGNVTFHEMGENAKEDMLFGEEQVATVAFTGSFDPHTIIAIDVPKAKPRVGDRIEAYSANKWWKGYIAESTDGEFRVHYYGWNGDYDEWIEPKNIRFPKILKYSVGQQVEVEWKKEWYPAKILEVKGGSHLITYVGYGKEWDEWVSSKRIRQVTK